MWFPYLTEETILYFASFKKKKNLLTYMSRYNAALQICKPLRELQMDDADKNFHRIIT